MLDQEGNLLDDPETVSSHLSSLSPKDKKDMRFEMENQVKIRKELDEKLFEELQIKYPMVDSGRIKQLIFEEGLGLENFEHMVIKHRIELVLKKETQSRQPSVEVQSGKISSSSSWNAAGKGGTKHSGSDLNIDIAPLHKLNIQDRPRGRGAFSEPVEVYNEKGVDAFAADRNSQPFSSRINSIHVSGANISEVDNIMGNYAVKSTQSPHKHLSKSGIAKSKSKSADLDMSLSSTQTKLNTNRPSSQIQETDPLQTQFKIKSTVTIKASTSEINSEFTKRRESSLGKQTILRREFESFLKTMALNISRKMYSRD
jgi:hypothetical protein